MLTTEITATMTSREIAELTGKEHKNVKVDIVKMLADLGEDALTFQRIYFDARNREQVEYALDRELTETLLTGYSAVLRRRVIARWRELEAAAAPAIPKTYAEALRLAADQQDVIAAQANQIAADAPKVAFAEIIRAMDGVCRIGDFCKTMKAGRNKLFARMKADKILMENRMPYQKYIDKGYFSVIEQKPYLDSKGVSHPAFTTMVTGAGQLFLTRKYHDFTGAA